MKYQLGILGLGKMGSSILSGIIKSEIYQKEDILLFDVNEELKKKYSDLGYIFTDNEQSLIDNVEMLILAIKPQMFKVLNDLKINNDLVVISIAAGKTIKDLEEIFGKQQFIRVMPNTPSLISYGATAITKSDNVLEETFNKAQDIRINRIRQTIPLDINRYKNIVYCGSCGKPLSLKHTKAYPEYRMKESYKYLCRTKKNNSCNKILYIT